MCVFVLFGQQLKKFTVFYLGNFEAHQIVSYEKFSDWCFNETVDMLSANLERLHLHLQKRGVSYASL